jgi:arylsulfatase A-like enzyme
MGNAPPWGGWSKFDDSETLPIWLQRAGYRTGIVGKYLNGYPVVGEETHVVPGWDEWRVPVSGAYDYWNYLVNENGAVVPHSQYQSAYVAETTSSIIEDFSATGDPFFVWSGFLAPHDGTPIEPGDPVIEGDEPGVSRTPAVEDRYRDTEQGELPGKPSMFEQDDADKNSFIRMERPFTLAHVTEQSHQRRESLRSVDDAVAAVIRTLRRTGELRDTVLVFASDNGYLLGEHGLNQKIFGYEESIRVPLLMAGPGIPAGQIRDQLVGLADVPTTLLDLAGVRPRLEPDGASLVPMLRDPSVGHGRHLLLEAGGWPFKDQDRLYTGIRTSDGRVLLRYWDGWVETYDLTTDPFQLDGTTSPAESHWRDRLLRELDVLEDCAGKECLVE